MTTGLKLEAVVLAAGLGTRFGGEKLTRGAFNGLSLIDHALCSAHSAPVREVIVVWGADPGVKTFAEANAARSVYALRFAEGISSR